MLKAAPFSVLIMLLFTVYHLLNKCKNISLKKMSFPREAIKVLINHLPLNASWSPVWLFQNAILSPTELDCMKDKCQPVLKETQSYQFHTTISNANKLISLGQQQTHLDTEGLMDICSELSFPPTQLPLHLSHPEETPRNKGYLLRHVSKV